MTFTVAIIGRPNVGKSTLFNRLTGKRHAIVDDTPGVTRDRREGMGRIGPMHFAVIDTAGMEDCAPETMQGRMMAQTDRAVNQADVVLMVIDGRAGIMPDDKYFAAYLRKKNKPIILAINKCEGKQASATISDAYQLGFADQVSISAEHGEGMVDLYDVLAPHFEAYERDHQHLDVDNEGKDKHIQIAIVGRPNAGKSTLLNQLLKEERVLTGPEAGLTRDSIAIDWSFHGKAIRLIDTAGLRRRSNVSTKLEKLAIEDSSRAIRYAHVVILMLDATAPLESQDITIAGMVIEEGRALVVALNKWDLVKDKQAVGIAVRESIEHEYPQLKGVPLINLSALHGNNLDKVILSALESYEVWGSYISTGKLNTWLAEALEKHPLPLSKSGKRIRIKYITQNKKRPPTFLLFTTRPDEIQDSYMRYLTNSLREEFNLPGIPIRLILRKTENPYEPKK